jgi:hypothetical protein
MRRSREGRGVEGGIVRVCAGGQAAAGIDFYEGRGGFGDRDGAAGGETEDVA